MGNAGRATDRPRHLADVIGFILVADAAQR